MTILITAYPDNSFAYQFYDYNGEFIQSYTQYANGYGYAYYN